MSNPTQNLQNIKSVFRMQLPLQTSYFPPKKFMISSMPFVLAIRPAHLLILLSIFKLTVQGTPVHQSLVAGIKFGLQYPCDLRF
jgi:hypothetical protein